MIRLLLVDNIDSFTFNLCHYLMIAGCEVEVVRNEALNADQMQMKTFDAAVLSPGPCTPSDAINLMPFLEMNLGKKPILGVCLGMQAIAMHYGWKLEKAHLPKHGKSSWIQHRGTGIFEGLQNPIQAGRYHSLIVHPKDNSDALTIEAECENEIMAISGKGNLVWGVQFHPESILTPSGQRMLNQWVGLAENIIRHSEK